MMRTHPAGTLRAENVGATVTLAGWVARRRDHGGVVFIDLRDASGVVQVVFRSGEVAEVSHRLRSEYCVQVTGDVEARPGGSENAELATGAIEVNATDLTVLSESAPLPFPLDEHSGDNTAGEDVRLRYRYLDLRREGPARAIRMRSDANKIARDVLHDREFVEIETPTLTRSTPEGARDFLVPARLRPGSWYALPQSPQLFKQLLMVSGMERYFQIARCYRDEDFRADRQPEFTQLDIEASFVDQDDVIALGEAIVSALWSQLVGYEITTPIPRMSYADAMARYGSDKPDLRFGLELTELTEYFAETPFRVFRAPYVGAIVMPGGAAQARRTFDGWQEWAKQRGARGLAYVLVGDDGQVGMGGPVAKNLSDGEREGLAKAVGASPGDCVFFAAGPRSDARALLGAARGEVARRLELIDEGSWSFVWIVDAPLFEAVSNDSAATGDIPVGSGQWTAVHHAFTSPTPEWVDSFESDPAHALAYAYDLVCNGNEIGGGS
ncbi:aspartate--tRNA ligase, partial [Actinomycetospora sp.]|uniref:aspartate--tRNA ligase n=1 Tax=Actinomycetospora sp. TaxID=1872135 RepID=UPI002F428F1B